MFFNKTVPVVAVTLLGLAACGGKKDREGASATPAAEKAQTVQTAAASRATWSDTYEATGTVRARVTSVLSARMMGHIVEIRPQVGETVKAGETVAVVDAREIETQYRQVEATGAEARSAMPEVEQAIAAAKAQLDLATSTHQRMKALFEAKSISEQEFDEINAKLRLARANFDMAQARRGQVQAKVQQTQEALATVKLQRGYAEVKAPFTGLVIERKAEPGMLAAPGMPLLILEQAGAYRLEASIEESMLGKIRVGTKAAVTLDAFDRILEARVTEVIPSLDAGSRSFIAKIDLPAIANVHSGVFGRARFVMGERTVVAAPQAAVINDGQVQRVLLVEDGLVRGRLVTTGREQEGQLEVLTGLTGTERLVSPVPHGLRDGGKIEVRQ